MPTHNHRSPSDAANRILQVACHLFSQHGYKAVGMRQLAKRVGVQPGSLYYHIESKQSLLYELIERYESEYLHTIRVVATKSAKTIDELVNELRSGLVQFVL
ncbi:TetR/AcrR family transcriptional regulator [Pseudomonas oryzihabitans]|uniref:TetR/AcrR family transcriptional regulator n=1 Tax=Pseudomonas oryzihabitans TaxID=47885 RepID=UPI0039173C14